MRKQGWAHARLGLGDSRRKLRKAELVASWTRRKLGSGEAGLSAS